MTMDIDIQLPRPQCNRVKLLAVQRAPSGLIPTFGTHDFEQQ